MSLLLQTILYGTFMPPDIPGRKVSFDDVKRNISSMPVAKRKVASRTIVENTIKEDRKWLSIGEVAALSGVCNDTAGKVLNELASELIVSKRYAKISKQGPKTALFKWIKRNAKKQKAA